MKSNINTGYALSKLGRYAEAEAAYRAAINVSATYSSARLNLAAVLRKQEKWEASADQCRAVIARDETDASAWNNLGVSLAKMGQSDKAAEAFSQVLELDPANVKARYNLALQLKKQNDTEQAESELRRVLKLSPDHFQSHLSLADILAGKGMRKDALALLDKALVLRPGDEEIPRREKPALEEDTPTPPAPEAPISAKADEKNRTLHGAVGADFTADLGFIEPFRSGLSLFGTFTAGRFRAELSARFLPPAEDGVDGVSNAKVRSHLWGISLGVGALFRLGPIQVAPMAGAATHGTFVERPARSAPAPAMHGLHLSGPGQTSNGSLRAGSDYVSFPPYTSCRNARSSKLRRRERSSDHTLRRQT